MPSSAAARKTRIAISDLLATSNRPILRGTTPFIRSSYTDVCGRQRSCCNAARALPCVIALVLLLHDQLAVGPGMVLAPVGIGAGLIEGHRRRLAWRHVSRA